MLVFFTNWHLFKRLVELSWPCRYRTNRGLSYGTTSFFVSMTTVWRFTKMSVVLFNKCLTDLDLLRLIDRLGQSRFFLRQLGGCCDDSRTSSHKRDNSVSRWEIGLVVSCIIVSSIFASVPTT